MKDYYEILGIDSYASISEIKKAYFKMVRKYPPDRYEKEFMDVREAYETLSNEKTRKEYDSIDKLSPIMKENYNYVRRQINEGDIRGAIRNLEKMMKMTPDSLVIKSLLGEAYQKNENNGKALKIFAELCEADPQNAAFAGNLAFSYLKRGWNKKAVNAYTNALKLDKDNISLWIGLADAHIISRDYNSAKYVFENALEKAEDIQNNITIYLKIIMMNIDFNMFNTMDEYAEKLKTIALENEEIRDNVAWTFSHISEYLVNIDKSQFAAKLIEKAAEILPSNKEIVKRKYDIENYYKYGKSLNNLSMDRKVHEEICALIGIEILPRSVIGIQEDDDSALEYLRYHNENEIVTNYKRYRKSIMWLQKEYPELYEIKAQFFKKVADITLHKKLKLEYSEKIGQYMKLFNNHINVYDDFSMDDEFDGFDRDDSDYFDYEVQEPYIREEEKIGRNDPCPCGSGKKYKKCCMLKDMKGQERNSSDI